MEMHGADGRLTSEQAAVVEQPADALVLVTAGAGAGKTHTLVRRLDHLLQDEGLSAGQILVLTFSRTAVRELRERILFHGGEDARQVRVMTFGSWAGRPGQGGADGVDQADVGDGDHQLHADVFLNQEWRHVVAQDLRSPEAYLRAPATDAARPCRPSNGCRRGAPPKRSSSSCASWASGPSCKSARKPRAAWPSRPIGASVT